jgi:hypothetical protein
MRTIILNQNNVVPNTLNDTYTYRFPNGSVEFQNDQVSVASISIYFSWFNISSATTNSQYNNNAYTYTWYDAGGATTYNVVMPDGFYEVVDLNAYLQREMVLNGHYLLDPAGQFVYYLELVVNQTYYGIQMNSFPIPTALPAFWSNPAGLTFPLVATTPQITIPSNNNFGKVIGFNAGTYPAVVQSTDFSKLSDFTPQITPINSLILSCTLLNNKYSNPNTLLYSFTTQGTPFGSLISIQVPQFAFVDIVDGSYTDFTIQFFDQNLNRIYINDSNIVVLLVIAKKEKYILN